MSASPRKLSPAPESRANAGIEAMAEAIERELVEVVPGLVLHDAELELEGEVVARFAGVDAQGCLCLVQLVPGDGPEPLERALDTLDAASTHRAVFARHYADAGLVPDAPPRVFLVAPEFSARTLKRLAWLAAVETFELRTLTSASGQSSYLIPTERAAGEGVPVPAARVAPTVDDFLAALDEPARALAVRLGERLARVDPGVRAEAQADGAVRWLLEGEPVARLERDGSGLVARTPPDGPASPLRGGDDLENVVEAVLLRLVEKLRAAAPRPEPASVPHAASAQADEEDLGPLPDDDLLSEEGPLLTPEEIEAFRR